MKKPNRLLPIVFKPLLSLLDFNFANGVVKSFFTFFIYTTSNVPPAFVIAAAAVLEAASTVIVNFLDNLPVAKILTGSFLLISLAFERESKLTTSPSLNVLSRDSNDTVWNST